MQKCQVISGLSRGSLLSYKTVGIPKSIGLDILLWNLMIELANTNDKIEKAYLKFLRYSKCVDFSEFERDS